jgi:hypothetical protein
MDNSCSVSLSQFPARFCMLFLFYSIAKLQIHTQAIGWKRQQFANSTLRDLRILFCQTDPNTWKRNGGKLLLQYRITLNINQLFIFLDCEVSIENEPTKGSLSQLLSLLFGESILQTSFVIVSEMFNYVRFYTFWYRCTRLIKIPIHHLEKKI